MMKCCLLNILVCLALWGHMTGISKDMNCKIAVHKEEEATVVVSIPQNIKETQSSFSLKKYSSSSDNPVPLLDFHWANGKFKCVLTSGTRNCSVSDDGQTVTAVLKHVNGHNGTYELQEVGGAETVTCMFSHQDSTLSEDSTIPSAGDGGDGNQHAIIDADLGAVGVAVIAVLVIFVAGLVVVFVKWYKKRGCWRDEAQNPEEDPILHNSPSASLSTGPQPGSHSNQPDHQQAQLLAGGGSGRPTIGSSTQPDYEALESTELEPCGGGAGDSVADVISQPKMDLEERITRVEERITRAEECITRVERNTRAEEHITRAEECNTRAEERITRAEERNTRAEEHITRAEECNTRAEECNTRVEECNTRAEECNTRAEDITKAVGRNFGRQFSNKVEHDIVEEDESETGDQPQAGHVQAVLNVFERLKDRRSGDKYWENACCTPSGTDSGRTAYAFDVQASSAPPVRGNIALTTRHVSVVHPEESSRSMAERTEPKL